MRHTADVLVIGIGGVGSAALLHLAERGVRAIGIDQFAPGHDWGSSHGQTRVIRTAYFEHPAYVPLAQAAFTEWERLERLSGQALLRRTGLFVAGTPESEAVCGTQLGAATHDLAIEVVNRKDVESRWPGFKLRADEIAIFEREAGVLSVEECVRSQAELAVKKGARLLTNEPAYKWKTDGPRVIVESERGTYEANTLILTLGAWAATMLRGLAIDLQVLRKIQLWGSVRSGAYQDSPIFYFDRPEGAFYGTPPSDNGQLKVALHTGGDAVDDPHTVDRIVHPEDVEPVADFVQSTLTSVQEFPVRGSTCLYTVSPDGHFVLDRHPEYENVFFAAGLSGHGFKFSNVLGKALAEMAIDGTSTLPVEFLSLDRFRRESSSTVD